MSKSRAIAMLPAVALAITLPLHGVAQEKRETPQPPPAAEPVKPPTTSGPKNVSNSRSQCACPSSLAMTLHFG